MKVTRYFEMIRSRPDRTIIKTEWIEHVLSRPVKRVTQKDGRFRLWAPIKEMDDRVLRVIILDDGETVHNAFFDRSFKP